MTAPEDPNGLREAVARDGDECVLAAFAVAETLPPLTPATDPVDAVLSLMAAARATRTDDAGNAFVFQHALRTINACFAFARSEAATLRAEVERVTAERDEWEGTLRYCEKLWGEERGSRIDRALAAEAEITRLKEGMEAMGAALKPFADEAEAISESSFSHFDDDSLAPSRFEIGELRRAAEALATLSPKEQP